MSLFTSEKKQREIPSSSGVYLMKDKTGKLIYIGKAKNLKNRIKNYYNLLVIFLQNQQYQKKNIVLYCGNHNNDDIEAGLEDENRQIL